MGGKTCLCCDLVGIMHISLNEIVTWRVVNNSTVELGYGFCLEVDLELWFGQPDDTTRGESDISTRIWWKYLAQTYNL